MQTDNIRDTSTGTGKGIDFAAEDEGHIVHQNVADNTAARSGDCTHRNGYPEGMPEGKRLLDSNDVEEGQTNGVEYEPSVVVVNDVFTE